LTSPRRIAGIVVLELAAVLAGAAPEVSVGDVASATSPGAAPLVGMGLVTGLAGKGDTPASVLLQETLAQLAASFGLQVSAGDVRGRNCAVVMVSTELPVFARTGERLDVTVSSVGDAKGIEDGVLLAAVLRDASGQPSVVAQGRLETPAGSRSVLTARISAGGTVQRDIAPPPEAVATVSLVLRHPDYGTARSIEQAILAAMPDGSARATDEGHVDVAVPQARRADVSGFIAQIVALRLTAEPSASVVVDARRGVVVIGEGVRIGRVAVAYRRMTVSVGTTRETGDSTFLLDEPATVADLVTMLQTLDLSSDDIIGILRAIDEAGALYGHLTVL